MHRILVREIMSSPVVTVGPDQLAVDAAQLMEEFSIRRLPVVDEDNVLLGIVTDTDVLEAETAEHVMSSYEPDVEAEWLAVQDIMSDQVVTVNPECSVGELASILIQYKVGGVPVVELQGGKERVIGIVTETDIFQMIVDAWQADQQPL